MKSKSFSPVGSLHPILFFAVVYIVALVLSVFICSSLFYSCNASPKITGQAEQAPDYKPDGAIPASTATMVMR